MASSPLNAGIRILLVSLLLLVTAGCEKKQDTSEDEVIDYEYPTSSEETDAPFVTTPPAVVDSMLSMAAVSEEDVVYDLGSGDGRIPIRAAEKYGARGIGIEIDSERVEEARQSAKEAGVADRVDFRRADLFKADISEATVVTIYLLPKNNLQLRPKLLQELEPGTRVVSHDFHMEEWTPDRTNDIDGNLLFLWHIPEEPPNFVEE